MKVWLSYSKANCQMANISYLWQPAQVTAIYLANNNQNSNHYWQLVKLKQHIAKLLGSLAIQQSCINWIDSTLILIKQSMVLIA